MGTTPETVGFITIPVDYDIRSVLVLSSNAFCLVFGRSGSGTSFPSHPDGPSAWEEKTEDLFFVPSPHLRVRMKIPKFVLRHDILNCVLRLCLLTQTVLGLQEMTICMSLSEHKSILFVAVVVAQIKKVQEASDITPHVVFEERGIVGC